MLMARDGGGMSRDRWSRVAPYLSIQFGQQMTDVVGAHIGVSLSPSTHISPSLSTGRGDDDFVKELMRTIGVVKELAFRPEENGIFTCEGQRNRRSVVRPHSQRLSRERESSPLA